MAAPTLAEVDHRPRTGFRADVQALRALAVLLLVLYHAGVPGLTGGYLGVDVFFVVSGFLITGLLVREQERTGAVEILEFYGRRMRRIMPAAALVLVVTVLAAYHWLGFIRGAQVAEDAEWSAVFLANLHFAEAGSGSALQHFWSLAVQAQFYLVWPVLFRLLSRRTIRPVAVLVVAGSVFSVFHTTQSYLWVGELGLGALLALSAVQVPRRAGVPLSLGGMAVILGAAFTGTYAAVPVLATCAVLAGGSAIEGTWLDRWYRVRPVWLLGLWSYALYLWHWPVLTIAWERLGHAPSPAARVFLVLWSVVLAAITYYAIENPIRKSEILRRNAVVSIALGLALIAGVVLVCVTEVLTT